MFIEGRTTTKGYRLFGSVRFSQSRVTTVSPPVGLGRISKFGCGGPLLPISPPITSTEPFARTAAVLYHLLRCQRSLVNITDFRHVEQKATWSLRSDPFSSQSFVPFTPSFPSGVYRRIPKVEASDHPPTLSWRAFLSGRTMLPLQNTSVLTCIVRQARLKLLTKLRSSS